jgi:hypothetical protein
VPGGNPFSKTIQFVEVVHRRNSGKIEPGIAGGSLDLLRNMTVLTHTIFHSRRYGGIAVNVVRDGDGNGSFVCDPLKFRHNCGFSFRQAFVWNPYIKLEDLRVAQHNFKIKLLGKAGSEVASLKPPFDVVELFQRKGRVPVKGTVNGFPFRSSLMNMGEGHMMVVNAELRAGAKCKAGDTVAVVMEIDPDERKVEVPDYLNKVIDRDLKAKEFWGKLSFTHQKEYVREIESAKRPETREKRIAAMMDTLCKNKRKK